jgi:hypothetical protein
MVITGTGDVYLTLLPFSVPFVVLEHPHQLFDSFEYSSILFISLYFFFHWHYSPSGPRPTSMKLSVSLRFFSES